MATENTEHCSPFPAHNRFAIFRNVSPDMDYEPTQPRTRKRKKRTTTKTVAIARKRLTLQDLPCELIMTIIECMDPVTSTCFSLSYHQFYIIHFRLRGPTHLNVFTMPPAHSPKTGIIILRNVLFEWFPKAKQYQYCKKRFIFVSKGRRNTKYRFRWGATMRKSEDFKRVEERRRLAAPLVAVMVDLRYRNWKSESDLEWEEDKRYYARCETARQNREAEEKLREREKRDGWLKMELERREKLIAKEERTKCKDRKLKLRQKVEEITAHVGMLEDKRF